MSISSWISIIIGFCLLIVVFAFVFSKKFRHDLTSSEGEVKVFNYFNVKGALFLGIIALFISALVAIVLNDAQRTMESCPIDSSDTALIFDGSGNFKYDKTKEFYYGSKNFDSLFYSTELFPKIDTINKIIYISNKRNYIYGRLVIPNKVVWTYIKQTSPYEKNRTIDENIVSTARDMIWQFRSNFEGLVSILISDTGISNSDENSLSIVQEEGAQFISSLESVTDNNLSIGYKILKYDLLNFAKAMMAELERERYQKEKLIEEGKEFNKICENLIEELRVLSKYKESLKVVWNWVIRESTIDRTIMLRAWLFALQYKLDGHFDNNEKKTIKEILFKELSPVYRKKHRLNTNPSLREFFP